jgi:hypothetical protein
LQDLGFPSSGRADQEGPYRIELVKAVSGHDAENDLEFGCESI